MKPVNYNQMVTGNPPTFSSLLDRLFQESIEKKQKTFIPKADIAERKEAFEINVCVPGVKKSDFKIEIIEGKLSISGERKIEENLGEKNLLRIETPYGQFQRSFLLPEDILHDKIEALYADGLLKIKIPKAEKTTYKSTIPVN
ncbi:Hsp20/alpha crystallin family protein [Rhodonellum sp.]|uniref:Hsp20/alpha crystallin family protein n=1 Tax=Rhodonellum sp. TaxID=2231180 RepID=UPI0027195727|nr:Hsp20/alpha crystallin family protein [Rhodonellum sp.]MDO9552147.1 Hsp20/alpha crystallin family protein [Rhodonellum sp.]